MSDGQNDGPIRNSGREMVDDKGKVYEIRDGRVEDDVPNPRDTVGLEPAAGYMGGGAGGIATSASTTGLGESDQNQEDRATSDSGSHGSIAEAADLGQRPLRDYKREGEPSFDATDTTMSASQVNTGPVDSSVSDGDMVAGSVGGTREVGTTIVDTSRDRLSDTSTTVRAEFGNEMGTNASSMATGGDRVMSESRTTVGGMGSDATTPASTGGVASDSISLDTDNTSPLGDVSSTETLTNVQEGMTVVDSTGEEIGDVRILRSGDTSSATVDDAGDTGGGGGLMPIPVGIGTGGSSGTGSGAGAGVGIAGLFGSAAGGGGEPNVPEPARSELTRVGFIKIDSKGFFASDRYASAEQISRVEGNTVYLSVAKDDLIS